MNKNQSKRVGVVFMVLILVGLAYFGWYLFSQKSDLPSGTATDPSIKTTAPSANTTTPTKSDSENKATADATTGWNSFSKDGFNFTFKYPQSWTIISAEITQFGGNPDIKQKTVKIKTDSEIILSFDNPATATDVSAFNLQKPKDITAGALTFKRNYGQNSQGQTLYLSTYSDPNNLDAASVSVDATGTINISTIDNLDNIVNTFKFTQ